MTFIGCQQASSPKGDAKADTSLPVITTQPVVRDVTTYMETIGTLEAAQLYEVRPQVHGTIDSIHTYEGAWVKKGDPLFTIDTRPYSIVVKQAEAQIAIDRANAIAAKQKVERLRPLAEKDLIPQLEWESAEASATASEAMIALDSARLDAAELDFENCTVFAIGDGRIGKISIYPGAMVLKGQPEPLVVISQMDPLVAEFSISEKEFPAYSADFSTIVIQTLCGKGSSLNCSSGFETTGEIFFLDNAFEATSGKLLVRAAVSNPEIALRPGQTIRVKIAKESLAKQLVVPQRAIKYDASGAYAWVIDRDNKAQQKHVNLGPEIDDDVVIASGLEPHESVVTVGHSRLSPGAEVEVKQ